MTSDRIPAALREALDALPEGYVQVAPWYLVERQRDRARAMSAALRWVWDLPSQDVQQIKFAIAALEQESEGTS